MPGSIRERVMSRGEARSRGAMRVGAALIAHLALFAVAGPWFSPYSYRALDWRHLAVPPGLIASHWLGTDALGRDLYVRTLYGLRL